MEKHVETEIKTSLSEIFISSHRCTLKPIRQIG